MKALSVRRLKWGRKVLAMITSRFFQIVPHFVSSDGKKVAPITDEEKEENFNEMENFRSTLRLAQVIEVNFFLHISTAASGGTFFTRTAIRGEVFWISNRIGGDGVEAENEILFERYSIKILRSIKFSMNHFVYQTVFHRITKLFFSVLFSVHPLRRVILIPDYAISHRQSSKSLFVLMARKRQFQISSRSS